MKLTQDDLSCLKTWTNNSGNMVQLLSPNVIDKGVHTLTLQSVNDPGG